MLKVGVACEWVFRTDETAGRKGLNSKAMDAGLEFPVDCAEACEVVGLAVADAAFDAGVSGDAVFDRLPLSLRALIWRVRTFVRQAILAGAGSNVARRRANT